MAVGAGPVEEAKAMAAEEPVVVMAAEEAAAAMEEEELVAVRSGTKWRSPMPHRENRRSAAQTGRHPIAEPLQTQSVPVWQ